MQGHIIHNQTINVAVDSEDLAHTTGETVKATYYDKVLPLLDEILTRLSPEDQVYRFNRLEIDLGYVPGEELKTGFAERISRLVEEAVSEKIERAGFLPPEDRSMEVIPVSASLFDAFLFYLEHGFLPWWLTVAEEVSPGEIFREIPDKFNQAQTSDLKDVLQLPKARTRLALQFPEDFVDKHLQSSSSGAIPENDSGQNERPALLPVLLSGLLEMLEKLGVSREIRGAFRMNMIRELPGGETAFLSYPLKYKPGREDKAVDHFIASSVKILIRTLAADGFDGEAILKILDRFNALLSDKSVAGHWFGKMEFTPKEIETIIAEYQDPGIETDKDKPEDDDKFYDEDETGIYIRNAGIVLVWPFLKNYFSGIELLAGERFESREEQQRAVVLLQHVVTGKEKFAEHQLPLNKILCGLPVDEPVNTGIRITAKEKKETEEMIRSAIKYWKAIGKVSVEGFRESFLKREGRLKKVEGGRSLKVERKTHDILLDKIPWMFSMVRLKWMKKMVFVDW